MKKYIIAILAVCFGFISCKKSSVQYTSSIYILLKTNDKVVYDKTTYDSYYRYRNTVDDSLVAASPIIQIHSYYDTIDNGEIIHVYDSTYAIYSIHD